MKKLAFLMIVCFISLNLAAQKQIDDANAEVRKVSGFHGIKVSHGITLYLTQGSSEAVAVSANETKYRDRIKTVVENGVLRIYFDNEGQAWKNINNRKLRAYVSIKDIDKLDVSSGADVRIEGSLTANSIDVDASSGATIHGAIKANSMDVDQSSGSVITISGSISGKLKIDGSSGSIFKGYNLTVENCAAETSSGAGVEVTVNKELSVDASSGGYIHYKGAGTIRDVHTSSGGVVARRS
jgi:cytoskeletal protein CcmA (bactofilin family)